MTSLIGSSGIGNRSASGMNSSSSRLAGDKIPKGYTTGQLQQYTPDQMNLFQQLFSNVGPDSRTARLAAGDEDIFNEIEAPDLRQFNALQGNIASRFSGMGLGARKSSGFQNTLNSASSNFAQDLASKRQGLQRQALQDLHGLSHSLLNEKPFERFMVEKQHKEPFWKQLLGVVSPIGGDLASGGSQNTQNFFNTLSGFTGLGG